MVIKQLSPSKIDWLVQVLVELGVGYLVLSLSQKLIACADKIIYIGSSSILLNRRQKSQIGPKF